MAERIKRWDLILREKWAAMHPAFPERGPDAGFRVINGERMGVRLGEKPFRPEPAAMTRFGRTVDKTKVVYGRVLGSPLEHVSEQRSPILRSVDGEEEADGTAAEQQGSGATIFGQTAPHS